MYNFHPNVTWPHKFSFMISFLFSQVGCHFEHKTSKTLISGYKKKKQKNTWQFRLHLSIDLTFVFVQLVM